uniref:RASD family member 2a n=1 Tax=Maylandia zebra TaxID=106582 RepID=A0A3P9C477_9CICH
FFLKAGCCDIRPRNCHRIVVLGAPRVGKTNILRRSWGKTLRREERHTRSIFWMRQGCCFLYLKMNANYLNLHLMFFVSPGDIFLLVFSLDDRESLSEACELLSEIKAAKAKLLKLKQPVRVPVIVCGNKGDLDSERVDIPFFETSAKTGTGLDAMFRALASLGGLPHETSPSRHQVIPILTYRSLYVGQRGRRGSRTRVLSAPCAAVDPLARRPSFNSDLQLVLGSSTKHNKPEKCQIQ